MNRELIKADNKALAALTPVNNMAIANMPLEQTKLILAALQPKIKELHPFDVETEIVNVIATVTTIAGQQLDGPTTALYAGEVFNKCLETFPGITIEEIRLALRAGVYGEYGKYYGLNPKTFFDFIKAYILSEERKQAKEDFERTRDKVLAAGKVPTEIERRAMKVNFIELLYKDYIAGKLITDYISGFVYDFLEETGFLKLTREQKNVIFDRAKSYLTRLETNPHTKAIETDLVTYLQSEEGTRSIRTIAKQFSVFDYFEQCKNEGKQTIFNNYLESKIA